MKYLIVQTVEELLKNADKPMLIEAHIREYIVTLRNPPYNLTYQTLNMYLSSIATFSAMNDISLNRENYTIPRRADSSISRSCLYYRRGFC